MNNEPSTGAPAPPSTRREFLQAATPTEVLPPFLVRRDDGTLELHLHCTWIQDYKICQLKFWLRYGLEIERSTPKWTQNYGGAIHESLAFRYKNLGLPLKTVESEQIKLLTKWFAKQPVADNEWRNLERAVQGIRAYNTNYPAHEWTVLGVEEKFSVKVGTVANPETGWAFDHRPIDVFLDGRKDLVVAWHDGIWVIDHKTCAEWGDDPEKNQELLSGRRSFQFRGYAWAEREAGKKAITTTDERGVLRATLPVRGVVGNYIIGRQPLSDSLNAVERRKTKKPKPRDDWFQEFFTFTDAVLDEWRDQFLLTAARILRDWQSGQWEQSFDRGCAYYGRCGFYEFCEGEQPLESAWYRKREPRDATVNEPED